MCSLGLSDHFVTMLLQLMDVEGSFSKISSMLKGIMKRKGEAASCIKEALHELEILISNIETFGMKVHCNNNNNNNNSNIFLSVYLNYVLF